MMANMHVRTAADTVVTALPCPHVYGNVVMNGALLYGMTLVLLERFHEAAVLQAIQTHRATMFEGVPTMYMYLLNYSSLGQYDLSSLIRCIVGGQTMPVAKMQEVNRTPGPNEVGELMGRGPIAMQGYFGNEKATRETIELDGWLHTGDLSPMDPEGYIFIVDRKKGMIITAGYNVYPAELERVIATHPAVAMVAVGSQPHALKGELAKAYVVLRGGAATGVSGVSV